MEKIILILFFLFSMEIQAQVDVISIEDFPKYMKENNLSMKKHEKFWEVLNRNHIAYTLNEKWIVESDTLCTISGADTCPINQKLGVLLGRLSHQGGKCLLTIDTTPKPINGKKLPLPFREELSKEYVFTRVANHFELGKPYRSIRSQALKDAEMLVTHYPDETAKDIFNGASMFIYPLNFRGETCQGQYTCGRGVVVFGKNNVPLELYFIMTDESIADFDKYLSELKGVFTFQDVSTEN